MDNKSLEGKVFAFTVCNDTNERVDDRMRVELRRVENQKLVSYHPRRSQMRTENVVEYLKERGVYTVYTGFISSESGYLGVRANTSSFTRFALDEHDQKPLIDAGITIQNLGGLANTPQMYRNP